MNINIIAGNCSEVNNEYIFSLLKNRDKNKNHIVIAPDRCQFNIEKRLFDETGEKCFFDVNVISLSRLSRQIIKNSTQNVLTKQSGVALVKKILKDNKDKLSVFSKAINYMGFADTLFKTICFYKSCFVLPNDIFVSDSMDYYNLKQKDIKLVYSEYEKYLQNEFTDSFNQLKLCADMINSEMFNDTVFYFVEFDDFTRAMYEIIIKLARFSHSIYLTCLYGKDNNNYNIYNNKVYYDLIDLFSIEGLNYSINKLQGFDNEIKRSLSTNLFSYNPQTIDLSNTNINIKAFDNIKDEVKFVLADIYSKILYKQGSLSDYALVVPSLSTYKKNLVEELKKYDMPYYLDESVSAINNAVIRLLFNIAKIVLGDYRLFDFSCVIKSTILNFDYNSVCEYDNYLRRIGAIADMCLNEESTEDQCLKEFILFIKSLRENIHNDGTYQDFVDIMNSICEYIKGRSSEYQSKLNAIDSRVFSQVCNKIDSINRDIINVFGDVVVKIDEFIDVYRAYYESATISMPPITSDTLFIADFESSYLSKFDYLYILGNNEGVLPSQKLDNGLITDDELAKLPNAKKLTPTVAMLNARKVIKLYDLIFKYNKVLELSYVNGNHEGKMYQNNLIQSLVKIGNVDVKNYSPMLDVINNSYAIVDDNNVVFNNLTKKIARENVISYLSAWKTYNHQISYREVCSSIYNVLDDVSKNIVDDMGQYHAMPNLTEDNLFLKVCKTSVSQIESFNRCPYIHFVKYGLRLSENINSKLKPNQIGSIIHEVLSSIVPIIIKKTLSNDDIKIQARSLLDKELQKEIFREMVDNIDNTYVIKSLYRELDRIVEALIREIEASQFVPTHYEYRFDNSLEINGIKIKGFIDRIDSKDNGFIIIDYKTGDNQFKDYNDVYSGKKLQLLIYAKAYQMISGKEPRGVFYLPISNAFGDGKGYRFNGVMLNTEENFVDLDRGLADSDYSSPIVNIQRNAKGKIKESDYYKSMCLSREDFDYLLNFAIKQVSVSIDKILAGEINPYPLKDAKSVCLYCEYKALCGYEGNNDHEVIQVNTIKQLKELNEEDGGI